MISFGLSWVIEKREQKNRIHLGCHGSLIKENTKNESIWVIMGHHGSLKKEKLKNDIIWVVLGH